MPSFEFNTVCYILPVFLCSASNTFPKCPLPNKATGEKSSMVITSFLTLLKIYYKIDINKYNN